MLKESKAMDDGSGTTPIPVPILSSMAAPKVLKLLAERLKPLAVLALASYQLASESPPQLLLSVPMVTTLMVISAATAAWRAAAVLLPSF